MEILLAVNSDIGRGNTIGFRFGKIAEVLKLKKINFKIIARANFKNDLDVIVPWYGSFFARFLNFIRIYLLPSFDGRFIDIQIFDHFLLNKLKSLKGNFAAAHLGEFSPNSIKYLKQKGIKVFLDIYIAHYSYYNFLNSTGIKAGTENFFERLSYSKIDQSLELADVLVAPSEFVKDTLIKAGFGNKSIVVVPFGAKINPDITPEKIKDKLKTDKLKFIFAGNVNYRKGIKYLLEAWKIANIENAELLICGRVYKEIKSDIAKYNLDNVKFLGFVDIKKYLSESHVFVFPTLLEGSAKAVYEAMSYGLPVITTYNAGSIVKDSQSGFIIPIADSRALAQKIVFFNQHSDQVAVMGACALVEVRDFTWDKYGMKVVEKYAI